MTSLENTKDKEGEIDVKDDADDNDDSEDETISINSYSSNSDSDNYSDIENDQPLSSKNSEKKNKSENIQEEQKTINDFIQSDVTDTDDDDETDDDEFRKLDNSRELLEDVHKSLKSINYTEVEKLTNIVRDKNDIIQDINHTTVPILSKYEKTKVIGLRAKQINNGAKPFINIDETIIDGYIIAEKELYQKKIPFIIKRPISNNKFEYWKLEDLECVY